MSALVLSGPILRRGDTGNGKLRGVAINADGAPAGRWVHIFKQHPLIAYNAEMPKTLIESVPVNPETGAWSCAFVDEKSAYTIIAHDPNGQYDPVMKTNLRPEPME